MREHSAVQVSETDSDGEGYLVVFSWYERDISYNPATGEKVETLYSVKKYLESAFETIEELAKSVKDFYLGKGEWSE